MKLLLTSAALALALAASPVRADDKSPPPSITLDNCAKTQTEVKKVDRPNGTVWLQSVTCTGDDAAPEEVRKPITSYVGTWSTLTTH